MSAATGLAPDCPIVEEAGCPIHGVADGFSLRAATRDGSVEAKGEEKWAWGVALLHTAFTRNLLWAKQAKPVGRQA